MKTEGVVRECCPVCGGTIVINSLHQYSIDYKVLKKGRISKKYTKQDIGPMEVSVASCKECKEYWETDDFMIVNDKFVDLKDREEEDG